MSSGFLTVADCGLRIFDCGIYSHCGLRIFDCGIYSHCGLRNLDCGFKSIADCGLWIADLREMMKFRINPKSPIRNPKSPTTIRNPQSEIRNLQQQSEITNPKSEIHKKMETLYGKLILPGTNQIVGTGWLPPRPDLRDYTQHQMELKELNKKLGISSGKMKLPASVDLRKWCSPIENQGRLGSCTAQAGVGIVEYYEMRAFEKHLEASRLFLYKTTRNLMQVTGDTGGWIRTTIGALALCGVPLEKYWPYKIEDFDVEPDAFIYSIADDYEALKYFCHDPQGAKIPFPAVLDSVKKYLEAGIPSMFGFWGFPSFEMSDTKGGIPYPDKGESAEWGHAIVAVGYDDVKKIKNTNNNKVTTGALLIRNSWGKEWGDKGYGWLPYDYILNNLALDFWSLLGMDWVDSKQFGI